eukprot:TRINITY_DN1479_c0_g1_i1.p1 TRINITY_DN1479_c0_g1~~TRINITY_DN1479_c0_g1_i1.p1  ORF type:complete len:491 (-),score=112.46 TRINITY_DN1479_c0_g1_i1:53-1525(-)
MESPTPIEKRELNTLRTSQSVPRGNKIYFMMGNPSVESINACLYLYNEMDADVSLTEGGTSRVVLAYGIPTFMSIYEFVQFIGTSSKHLSHIRILSEGQTRKQYMILLKFHSLTHAVELFSTLNGKNFTSLSKEVCYIGFVRKVKFLRKNNFSLFPTQDESDEADANCTICLEKLSFSSDPLLTILCGHSFHSSCLLEWKDENKCPICRYRQFPTGDLSTCYKCGTEENVWVCLICGYVGCSRYQKKHSIQHYHETKHTYALEVETQKVWDYASEGYVHRLIQNEIDQKLVETGDPTANVNTITANKEELEKTEAMGIEFEYMLTAYMESQKLFFMEKLDDVEKENRGRIQLLEDEFSEVFFGKNETEECLMEAEREKYLLERRTYELETRIHQIAREKKRLENLNDNLRKVNNGWKAKVEEVKTVLQSQQGITDSYAQEKEDKINELEKKVRDLMEFIESGMGIDENNEASQGQVVVKTNKPNRRRKRN